MLIKIPCKGTYFQFIFVVFALKTVFFAFFRKKFQKSLAVSKIVSTFAPAIQQER
jgi:hypothetical protein